MHITGKKSYSSRRWLERQRTDPYVKRSIKDGYRSRAAYKLLEIAQKFCLFQHDKVIVDLGAAPGGWSQVIAQMNQQAHIIAIDLLEMDALPHIDFICGNFMHAETHDQLRAMILTRNPDASDRAINCIVSDMAPSTIGHAMSDHLRMMALAEEALQFAIDNLATHGTFLIKLFQGGEEKDFADTCKQHFEKVKFLKPSASRKESREIYLLAQGFFQRITS